MAQMMTRSPDDVLVPVSMVLPRFRCLFPYQTFNAMQSRCFETAYGTDQSMVVSAPTGSGKTVVLELALARLWSASTDPATRPTAIYIAPLKALTHERLVDWRAKLSGLGIKCFELTGDTEDADMAEQAVRDADLIVTTPEKWDSFSRFRRDAQGVISRVGLLLLDEIHLLNDAGRGPTLEAVVARMRTLSQSAAVRGTPIASLRSVSLSATISNHEDIARWLDGGCLVKAFDESYRPVPLQWRVLTYPMGSAPIWRSNPRLAARSLHPARARRASAQTSSTSTAFSSPSCPRWCGSTRAAARRSSSATHARAPASPRRRSPSSWAARCCRRAASPAVSPAAPPRPPPPPAPPACPPPLRPPSVSLTASSTSPPLQGCPPQRRQRLLEAGSRLRDAKLRELVPCGVGFHTAGLEAADRTAVEQLFAEGALAVLCSTGGLAQGVNLPAHLVVLMNTAKYAPRLQGYEEYSTIEVLQMAGRAGRPQFDASGRVVVMTRPDAEQRYTALMGGALHHASDQPSI